MNIFNRHKKLEFSNKNIKSLSESICKLESVLIEIGTNVGLQVLTNIQESAIKKDSESFRNHVLTNELFGGAGALWELHCDDKNLQVEFQNRFKKFCAELKNIGINNPRINQVTSGL